MTDIKRSKRIVSDAELVEFMRYVMLSREDLDLSDEFSAAVYSTWYLMNPQSVEGRDAIGSIAPYSKAFPEKVLQNAIKFTAHAHPKEPQTPSPDDLVIYSSMKPEDGDTVNIITDRFSAKKIL